MRSPSSYNIVMVVQEHRANILERVSTVQNHLYTLLQESVKISYKMINKSLKKIISRSII